LGLLEQNLNKSTRLVHKITVGARELKARVCFYGITHESGGSCEELGKKMVCSSECFRHNALVNWRYEKGLGIGPADLVTAFLRKDALVLSLRIFFI